MPLLIKNDPKTYFNFSCFHFKKLIGLKYHCIWEGFSTFLPFTDHVMWNKPVNGSKSTMRSGRRAWAVEPGTPARIEWVEGEKVTVPHPERTNRKAGGRVNSRSTEEWGEARRRDNHACWIPPGITSFKNDISLTTCSVFPQIDSWKKSVFIFIDI